MAVQLQKVYDETRRITNTNSTQLTDANMLLLANQTYLEIQRELGKEGIEVFGIVSKADFIVNQDDFALPDDCIEVVRLEVAYNDPTKWYNWIKATAADLGNIPMMYQDFVNNILQQNAEFNIYGGQIYMGPQNTGTTQIQGLRLWYIQKQTDFVGATDNIPYPLHLYWEIMAWGCAYRFWMPFSRKDSEAWEVKYRGSKGDSANNIQPTGIEKIKLDLGKQEVVEPIKTQHTDYYNHGWF